MSFSRGQVVKSFFWKLLERSGAQIITFIVSIILARLLEPSEYGIIAIITIFINLANVIIDGGLNTALIQKKNADDVDSFNHFIFLIAPVLLCLSFSFFYSSCYSNILQ